MPTARLRLGAAIALLSLTTIAPGAQAASATKVSATALATAAPAIIGQALSPSPLGLDLQALTDGVGGRVSGSAQMKLAVDWGLNAFKSAGISAHAESYTQPLTWAEGATKLEVVGAKGFPVSIVSQGWSASTPVDGIEATLVHVGAGSEADFAKAASIKGSIVLVDSEVIESWADLNDEYDRVAPIIERSIAGGAKAILWTAARAKRLMYRHTDTVDGELSTLPMAVVAREDAQRLARLADSTTTRVRLTMPNQVGGAVEENNVVGEIRGVELPNEFIVIGAHLDSWDLGTGALDNGCNAALVIAAARAIQESGVHPKRTLRFVLFSGEEEGMQGSRAYVRAHRAELDKTRAMIAIDSGMGRIYGFNLSGRAEVQAALTKVLQPLAAFDVANNSLDGDLGTDNVEFMLEGVPTLVARQEAAEYMKNYHAASDTLDKVDLRQLAQHVAIAATLVYSLGDSDPVGPRLARPQIERLLIETGLEKQMKAQGIWDAWVKGSRGRALTP